tara:strand:- start:7714 stop:9651 length:1938 start_codon:yes stop_codon:yes gene_type:complete
MMIKFLLSYINDKNMGKTMLNVKQIIICFLFTSVLTGCGDDNDKDPIEVVIDPPKLSAGASSQSLLPTVNGSRTYLNDAPGWLSASEVDANSPGLFIADWDQGQINVGNGEADASWVHDDIRVTALALDYDGQKVILVSTDTYMHIATDVDKMIADARVNLSDDWVEANILFHATHNHHGPDTAFEINDDWYQMASDQITLSIHEAIDAIQPATTKIATGMHGYGAFDQRDPRITDDRLNVMTFNAFNGGESIATMVQWASHPETTLGFEPDPAAVDCPSTEVNCNAEDRYFTADFPGVLQQRLKESHGGEVLYLNGAIGVLIATLHAPAWVVTDEHPVGNGHDVPEGAAMLREDCSSYECKNFLKTESIGHELFNAVVALIDQAEELDISEITVTTNDYFTQMSNFGFSYLAATGGLGWQERDSYTCEIPFSVESCINHGFSTIDDPVFGSVLEGSVTKTRFTRVDFGDVGMMYMPGEVPPELVIGLPEDFSGANENYYLKSEYHAVGDDYIIPGYLLSLPSEDITFTVGLGTDQLGYHVPLSDYRIFCPDDVLASLGAPSCAELHSFSAIEGENWISGARCKAVTENDAAMLETLGALVPVIEGICRYGQALGRADEHYHETNSLGWDLVDDMWKAAESLYQD